MTSLLPHAAVVFRMQSFNFKWYKYSDFKTKTQSNSQKVHETPVNVGYFWGGEVVCCSERFINSVLDP